MDANRFVQKGGDPALLSIRTHSTQWLVLCEDRQVFAGDIYACVHWRAQAERLAKRRQQRLDNPDPRP